MDQQLFVKMALHAWDVQISRTDKMIKSLTDEQLLQEVSPGRNRVVYLLGHLIAVNDGILKILGLGDRLYPHLDEAFLTNPDRSGKPTPSVKELREAWDRSNQTLTEAFKKLTPAEWFQKHASISEEDFAKEPHRNKLSVLLNRTSHVAYHLGQIVLIKKNE
jgi:hypothetical protein